MSALVVEHLRLHPGDRAWLIDLLQRDRDETPELEVQRAIARFRSHGALAAVWQRLEALQDRVSDTPALRREHRLHAVAIEWIARCLVPIVHTHPNPPTGGPT